MAPGNKVTVSSTGWQPGNAERPRQRDVLNQIGSFLQKYGFADTQKALIAECTGQDIEIDTDRWNRIAEQYGRIASLEGLWNIAYPSSGWPSLEKDKQSDRKLSKGNAGNKNGGVAVEDSSNNDISDDSSSSDSDTSSDSRPLVKTGQKRKRSASASSSSDDSSSDSSLDVAPAAQAAEASSDDSASDSDSESDSDSSSDSDDSDARPLKRAKVSDKAQHSKGTVTKMKDQSVSKPAEAVSSSDSSSESSTDSSSDSSASESSDDSSDDSSSDSQSDTSVVEPPTPQPQPSDRKKSKSKTVKALQIPAVKRNSSDSASSATLGAPSPNPGDAKKNEIESTDTLVVEHAESQSEILPATKANLKKLKKENAAFSRIPADIKVEAKFASNAYVPYDYADRAYQDLSVTKGKGFTKEKNKKKRGAYRGGAIDLTPKAIKFDD